MPTASHRVKRGAVLATLVVSALLATKAYTSSGAETADYVCEDGDRFVVEFLADHVRLRHGTGIFALAEVKPGRVYSDGRMLLYAGEREALLEQPAIGLRQHCVVVTAPA